MENPFSDVTPSQPRPGKSIWLSTLLIIIRKDLAYIIFHPTHSKLKNSLFVAEAISQIDAVKQ
jgi:hypothetical protein